MGYNFPHKIGQCFFMQLNVFMKTNNVVRPYESFPGSSALRFLF